MQYINKGGKAYPFLISLNVMRKFEKTHSRQIPDFDNDTLEDIVFFFMLCFEEGQRKVFKLSGVLEGVPFDEMSDFIDAIDISSEDYEKGFLESIKGAATEELKKKVAQILNQKKTKSTEVLKQYTEKILKH